MFEFLVHFTIRKLYIDKKKKEENGNRNNGRLNAQTLRPTIHL